MASLNKSKNYRSFIIDRDKALEVLLNKCQVMVSDTLRGIFSHVIHMINYDYKRVTHYRTLLDRISQQIDMVFQNASALITTDILQLKVSSYVLSATGEAEAIARATGKKIHYNVTKEKINKIYDQRHEVQKRVNYLLDRRRRRILDALQLSLIQGEDLDQAIERVLKTLPKPQRVKRPLRVLKPIKEADKKPNDGDNFDLSTGFVDDQAWDDMLDDYKTEYVPRYRGPEAELDFPSPDADITYGWELEKEINHEFVQQVRDGQEETANQNGITDFMWLSIIDDRTDDCCVWRDGKTSNEISLALQNEQSDDECDAIVPPAHFNCRCTMAPVYENMPDAEPDITGDFLDWLNE